MPAEPPVTASPLVDIAQDDMSLADLVRSQARQIVTLISALEAMATARALPVVPVAPASAPIDLTTFAELWTEYIAALGERTWIGNVLSMMGPALAWFAPSLITPRERCRKHRARAAQVGPDMLVAAFSPQHWTAFRGSLGDYSVTYRNLMLARLKAFFRWAIVNRRLKVHPLADIKPEKKKPRRETWIDDEQLQRVLAHDNRPEFRAYMLTAFDTGMRSNEVRTLQWSQIDMLTGAVRLSWTTTKTSHTRTVYLSPRAKDAIRECRKDHSSYVFAVRAHDKPLSQTWFWRHFRDAADAAKIDAAPGDGRLHFHDSTRHSFGNRFLRAGGRLDQLQKTLGHADLGTTQLCLHTTDDDVRDGFELLRTAERKPPHSSD